MKTIKNFANSANVKELKSSAQKVVKGGIRDVDMAKEMVKYTKK